MEVKKISLSVVLILFVFFVSACTQVMAQQTIINVPSSEVLPGGDLILKNSTKGSPFGDKYASIVPSVTLGTGFGTEISTGIGTSIEDGYNTNVKAHISAKKVWFLGASTRLTVGGTISPSLSSAVHPDTFSFFHFSQRIKKTKTSITAGAYLNGRQQFCTTGGAILGIEQVVISNKLRIAVDWLSDQNNYGKMGVGIKYRPVPTLSVTGAVIIPNKESDNIAFNISLSKFISLDNENPIKRRFTNVD